MTSSPEVVEFARTVKTTFPVLSGKIDSYVGRLSAEPGYYETSDHIFRVARAVCRDRGWTDDDLYGFYADFVIDYLREQQSFLSSGQFSNEGRSFDDIREEVYQDDAHMTGYMMGLLVSYAIFPHHFAQYRFYVDRFLSQLPESGNAIEFGCGHGLFLAETAQRRPQLAVQGFDVSPAALAIAESMVKAFEVPQTRIHLSLDDVVALDLPSSRYVAMTAAGLLEHIADPHAFLTKIHRYLEPGIGRLFVMLPVNTAHADHMILFDHPDDCRKLMSDAGFTCIEDLACPTVDLSEEELAEKRIPILYVGIYRV